MLAEAVAEAMGREIQQLVVVHHRRMQIVHMEQAQVVVMVLEVMVSLILVVVPAAAEPVAEPVGLE
jgi:hypothetical protein